MSDVFNLKSDLAAIQLRIKKAEEQVIKSKALHDNALKELKENFGIDESQLENLIKEKSKKTDELRTIIAKKMMELKDYMTKLEGVLNE